MLFALALTFSACQSKLDSDMVPALLKRAQLQPVVDKWKAASKDQVDDLRNSAIKSVDLTHDHMANVAWEWSTAAAGGTLGSSLGGGFVPIPGAGAAGAMGSACLAIKEFNDACNSAYNQVANIIFDHDKCKTELAEMVRAFVPPKADTKRRKLGATFGAVGAPTSPSGALSPLHQLGRALSVPGVTPPSPSASPATSVATEHFTIHTPPPSPRSPVAAPDSTPLPEGPATPTPTTASVSSSLSEESMYSAESTATALERAAPELSAEGAAALLVDAGGPEVAAAEGASSIPGIASLLSPGIAVAMGAAIRVITGNTNDECRNKVIEQINALYKQFDAAIEQQGNVFLNTYAPI